MGIFWCMKFFLIFREVVNDFLAKIRARIFSHITWKEEITCSIFISLFFSLMHNFLQPLLPCKNCFYGNCPTLPPRPLPLEEVMVCP